jgi:hypothetical protein
MEVVEVVELLEVESSLEVELLEEASLTFNTQS